MRRWLLPLLLLSACRESSDPAPDPRPLARGFVAIPRQPVTTEAWLECFDLVAGAGQAILHHEPVDWAGTSNLEFLHFLKAMADVRGLALFVVVDPLTPDRAAMDPAAPGTSFADPSVRAAVVSFAARLAREFRPAWLAIGSEVNTYLGLHPGETADFVSLFTEAAGRAKAEAPSSRILATFQYEGLTGTAGRAAQWDLLAAFGPSLEAVGITTYPAAWFATPEDLPPDYYDRLRVHDSRPLVIAESGWPAEPGPSWSGSPQHQADFVDRLGAAAVRLEAELWIWWFLHDWDGGGYPDYFRRMGLRTSAGEPRPAWDRWKAM